MLSKGNFDPASKGIKIEKLDKALKNLEELIETDLAITVSPAVQQMLIILSILVQFVKNHEHLFLAFYEAYRQG